MEWKRIFGVLMVAGLFITAGCGQKNDDDDVSRQQRGSQNRGCDGYGQLIRYRGVKR